MLILSQLNDILGFKDSRGIDIFYPNQRLGESVRGGAHICAPVFGHVPSTQPEWRDLMQPRHGLARIKGAEMSGFVQTTANGEQTVTKFFPAKPGYFYNFETREYLKHIFGEALLPNESVLEHSFQLRRAAECPSADKPMPVSLGWHPYFATHNEEFTLFINGTSAVTSDSVTKPAAVYDYFGQTFVLKTKHHVFEFTFFGVEQIVIWSDDKTRYLCLEPTAYTEKARLLQPGDMVALSTKINIAEL